MIIEVEEERIKLLEDLLIVTEKMMRDYVNTMTVELAVNGKTPDPGTALTLTVARVIIERYQFKYPNFSTEEEFEARLNDYKNTFMAELQMVQATRSEEQIHEELMEIGRKIAEENG
ncbi:MAG: hypothetical protein ACREOB_12605 [Thermodesulfobacteriota bacterium]